MSHGIVFVFVGGHDDDMSVEICGFSWPMPSTSISYKSGVLCSSTCFTLNVTPGSYWGRREKEGQRERERKCVCVCVCVREQGCISLTPSPPHSLKHTIKACHALPVNCSATHMAVFVCRDGGPHQTVEVPRAKAMYRIIWSIRCSSTHPPWASSRLHPTTQSHV